MGIVMWGFSLATIAGVPAGLIVAEQLHDWRAPFVGLAGLVVLGPTLLRIVWGALAIVAAPIVGLLTHWAAAAMKTSAWKALLL